MSDYVTEKIFNVYRAGAVPVYMGAPNIDVYFLLLANTYLKYEYI